MLSNEQIEQVVQDHCDRFNSRDSVSVLLDEAVRAALELASYPAEQRRAAEQPRPPAPPRKPWPKLPVTVKYLAEAEAIALAMNMLPACVDLLRRWALAHPFTGLTTPYGELCGRRDAALARIEQAGFDLLK